MNKVIKRKGIRKYPQEQILLQFEEFPDRFAIHVNEGEGALLVWDRWFIGKTNKQTIVALM